MKTGSTILSAVLTFCLAIAMPVAAQEAARRFDPRDWRNEVSGRPTEVLVLASPHLSGTPDTFDPAVLEPLLAKLQAFQPTVIALEALSGESLQGLEAYQAVYPESAKTFGASSLALAAKAQAEIGLSLAGAEAAARERLMTWPEAPSYPERRALAALFAASGEPYSALVQWWQLPPAEQRAGDGVSAELAADLQAYAGQHNENHLIGVQLAVRLGLQRVWPVDDHDADDVMTPRVVETLTTAMSADPAVAALMADPDLDRLGSASQRLTTADEVIETYRYLNTPEAAALDARLQWLIMIAHDWPQGAGRVRMAEWEARNLRQVAHIREAMAQTPGARVLVIVGAAHKAWFEAYLDMMPDVELVDAATILR